MGTLSENTPKPILTYQGKNLIQHKLEQLPDIQPGNPCSISEVIIVVGYLGNAIKEAISDVFTTETGINIPITYVWQQELKGTADSLWQAKDILTESGEPFVVLMGDDLYSMADIQAFYEMSKRDPKSWAILVKSQEKNIPYGKVKVDERGNLIDFIDDLDQKIPYNKMYTGACLLTTDIFDLPMIQRGGKGEYGLPFTLAQASSSRPIKVIETTHWKRITTPEDLI